MTTSVVELLRDPDHGLTVYGEGRDVRILATGLANKLGYPRATRMLELLREDEHGQMEIDSGGGRQKAYYVTLPGLFRSLGSRKASSITDPQMRAMVQGFQDWIYREVVPGIVVEGYYATPLFMEGLANTTVVLRGLLRGLEQDPALGDKQRRAVGSISRMLVEGSLVKICGGEAAISALM